MVCVYQTQGFHLWFACRCLHIGKYLCRGSSKVVFSCFRVLEAFQRGRRCTWLQHGLKPQIVSMFLRAYQKKHPGHWWSTRRRRFSGRSRRILALGMCFEQLYVLCWNGFLRGKIWNRQYWDKRFPHTCTQPIPPLTCCCF